MMLGAVGFMFGTGGTALVAIALGEGKKDKANKLFSLFVYTTIICGISLAILGIIFIRPIGMFLGATGEMPGYPIGITAVITTSAGIWSSSRNAFSS